MTMALTTTGEAVRLDGSLDQLARSISGEVIHPGDRDYHHARSLWNGLTQRSPAVVVRCAEVGDVQTAVCFAADRDLLVAVRAAATTSPELPASTEDW